MSKPASREGLIDYCLRSLGHPVIEINIDDDQISDRIDDAIQFYQEYHTDAVIRTYVKHQVTQEEIDQEFIELPDALLFVSRVIPIGGYNSSSSMFSIAYQLNLNDLYGMRNPGDVIHYEMTRQFMNILDRTFNGMGQTSRFNRHMGRLYIDMKWSEKLTAGDYIVIEGYITVDPQDYPKVYNDIMVKRYATALIKRQWGQNLSKFSGIQLPGGVTINGSEILTQANEEVKQLETEMRDLFQAPPEFFVG